MADCQCSELNIFTLGCNGVWQLIKVSSRNIMQAFISH